MKILTYALLLYWAFALLNVVANLLVFRRPRKALLAREPFVSIIVPARDEERAIERAVRAMLAQDYAAFEVIVVDDRSTDSTGAILARIAAEDARLVVVHGEEPPAGWLGKPWALHQGSLVARGEMLLFVDADVHYEPAALRAGVDHIEATCVAMTFLFPRIEARGFWENAVMPGMAMTALSLPYWLGELLHVQFLGVGGGTGNLIRRVDYDAIGGHTRLRNAVVDDVSLGISVRRAGRKSNLTRADHLVSVRMYHGLGEIVRGFTKNMFAIIGRSYAASVLALVLTLVLHIVPFVLALAGNRVAIATVVLITLTRISLFSSLRYPLWSALLCHPLQSIVWAWILIRSVWITGIRGELSWRGRTYDPAQTRFGPDFDTRRDP